MTADVIAMGYDDEQKMKVWDEFIGLSIQEGMNVDLIGVNPQHRSCILRYWTSYLHRQMSKTNERQIVLLDTVQTDTQEVTLPMMT